MKYALIGCGRISINHIKSALENNLEIKALCDSVEENAISLLKKCGLEEKGIRIYRDYRELLSQYKDGIVDLDLVSIATPSGLHAQIAIDVIDCGLNVIIEKPIAMSLGDADRIIEHADKMKVKVATCHQNRFNLAIQKIRRALERGSFGKLSHGSINVRWNRERDYYEQAQWRGTWEQDGGCLMNQCIHGIDLLRWMMGDEVTEVYGVTRQRFHDYLEAEDIGLAVLKFANGAVGTIEGTTNVYPKNLEESLYLFGSKGTVKAGGKSANTIEVWDFADEEECGKLEENTVNVYGNGHARLFRDMIDAINHDRSPYVDAHAGRRALEVVLAIYKSQKTGLPVVLPLQEFSSLDMCGEFD